MDPPCSSFSIARTPPIRTRFHINGVPSIGDKDRGKVREGNSLCFYSCKCLALAIKCGIPCSLEQPRTSLMWIQPRLQKFTGNPLCCSVCTDFCGWGTPWKKSTGIAFWHARPLHLVRKCTRDHEHVVLRGHGPNGVPWTRVAQPYPAPLCHSWAQYIDWLARAARCTGNVKAFRDAPRTTGWDSALGYPGEGHTCICAFIILLFLLPRLIVAPRRGVHGAARQGARTLAETINTEHENKLRSRCTTLVYNWMARENHDRSLLEGESTAVPLLRSFVQHANDEGSIIAGRSLRLAMQ